MSVTVQKRKMEGAWQRVALFRQALYRSIMSNLFRRFCDVKQYKGAQVC